METFVVRPAPTAGIPLFMIKALFPHFLLGLTLLPLAAPSARADMQITAADGFILTWDNNEADHFTADEPAPVPDNLALAAGSAPITSSDLGPLLGLNYHVAGNLNDGLYGNSNSWIGGNAVDPFAGITLGGLTTLTSFAFGRDNGNNVSDPQDNGYLGQLPDRCLGLYTVQITRVSFPDATTAETGDASTGWQTVGTLNYVSNDDTVPGELFTAYYRHQFTIGLTGGGGVQATAFRLRVPTTGIGGGTDIDELELYGTVVVTLDKDGDGFDDTVETALGFDPNNASSSPEGQAAIETAVEFSFWAANGKTYTIQESEDLTTWKPVEENVRGKGEKIRRLYSQEGKNRHYYRAIRVEA